MTTLPKWGGSKARAWSAAVLREYGRVCVLRRPGCTIVATTGDHIIPRSVRPDLQYDVTNGQPACGHCNSSRKATPAAPRPFVDDRRFFESAPSSQQGSRLSPPRDAENFGGWS